MDTAQLPADLPPAFNQRTWFQLRAAAHVHRLRFNTRWTQEQAYRRIVNQLVPEGSLKTGWHKLTRMEQRALQTLQAAGGSMVRGRFTRMFGYIRPCTQRQPQNWRIYVSAAEHLWLMGYIEFSADRHQLSLTREAVAHLPPLPQPQRVSSQPADPLSPRTMLCVDLAALLGTLLREEVAPLYGRWLPPRVLRVINRQICHPQSLTDGRAERSAGRLSFLHYLAETAGLIAVQGGFLKPTVAAWAWLALPPDQQWRVLWDALEADRAGESHALLPSSPSAPLTESGKENNSTRRFSPLSVDGEGLGVRANRWSLYRLPEVDDAIWTALVRWLARLPAGIYSADSLADAVRPYCPPTDGEDDSLLLTLEMLLETVFAWLGWAAWDQDMVIVHPVEYPAAQQGTLIEHDGAYLIDLPLHPPLLPFMRLSGWCAPVKRRVTLDPESFRAAIERGASALTLASTLADLVGTLPDSVLERFRLWERSAGALRLQTMTVLTADDPAVLDALCADRAVRRLIDKPLSRHHVAVRPEHVPDLCRRLKRRGYPAADLHTPAPDAPASADLLAYCYLAVRTFQQLGDLVPLPADMPASVRRWLADQLPSDQPGALDTLASQAADTFAAALHGHVESPPITAPDPEATADAIQTAYESQQPITLDYFSPARGALTTRRVQPIRWYERGGARYFEAWCDLDGDTRTFRLDRVMRVHSP